ncbi:hypothetical protein SAMN05421677_101309 [Halobacillus aidingensis]|uniref:Uncharacterized protein n=1 Tax=Halobacillus aidingensis TaxID=240303 RepID=A0A1H0EUI3_HALAD|nr:hypothetical protein SAMN05421677_101309 [Halobacillus aidingensis]
MVHDNLSTISTPCRQNSSTTLYFVIFLSIFVVDSRKRRFKLYTDPVNVRQGEILFAYFRQLFSLVIVQVCYITGVIFTGLVVK